MYTAAFHYFRPATLGEAEEIFRASDDAHYIAGGQSLIPAMRQRLATPGQLVDLSRIPSLAFIRHDHKALVIGAGATHAEVAGSGEVQQTIPALAFLAGLIGDPAVRHRGTLGGSIANNDPAADYPAAVLALNATICTTRRRIAADDFFTGMFETALEPGEILTEISFPVPRRAAYRKFPNPASRYAMPRVFIAEHPDAVRVAVTGAAPCVYREQTLESALAANVSPQAIDDLAISPGELSSDLFASAEYRAQLIRVMARRAAAAMI